MGTALLGCAAFSASPALAQEAATPTGDAPPPVAKPTRAGKRVYLPADFARFAPRTALDMLNQVPGFTVRGEDTSSRGLGQASGNVLLNGGRLSGKSTDPVTALQAIPAGNVQRIELVDAAELDVPGLTGQVANVIYEAKARISGQFSYRPEFRAHYADPLYTRGDVSVSGTHGPIEFTVSLRNDASRSGAGGPTLIERGDGSLIETRDDSWTSNFDQPQLSGQFKVDGPGSSLGNLNLLGRRFNSRYDETSRRDRAAGVDQLRFISSDEKGWNYEMGGDYEFALVGGRLKLIGLNRYSDEPFISTVVIRPDDGSPAIGSLYAQDGHSRERIGRAEYRWKMGKTDLQLSGERAYNSLDITAELGTLGAGDVFVRTPFPQGTGKVTEDRYESLLTIGRPLSGKVTAQLVAGAEYSTIEQVGAGGKERSFFRPKGSLNIAAQLTPTFNANLKIARRVGQLDFGQFLARVFLDADNENAGNPDLVPDQQTRFELELAKDLGAWGKTRVNLVAALFKDRLDIIPIGESGESPGNIPKAQAYAIDWNSTLQFDPIGWKGAKLNVRALQQFGSIRDPLTGDKRKLSSFTDRVLELGLRHDIPKSDWAWGANANYSHVTKTFRLNEFGRQFEGPVFMSAFVEHKDVYGLTVRASVSNIVNARSRWDRVVYAGRRNSAPIDFIETRNRLIGPIFSFSVRGTF
jgi:outer membrane cobalamin receptor